MIQDLFIIEVWTRTSSIYYCRAVETNKRFILSCILKVPALGNNMSVISDPHTQRNNNYVDDPATAN